MVNWILGPIDHRSEIWSTYPVQRIVVEASAEREAREKVAERAVEVPQPSPWIDPALTSCEEITAPETLAPLRGARAAFGLGPGPELPFHA